MTDRMVAALAEISEGLGQAAGRLLDGQRRAKDFRPIVKLLCASCPTKSATVLGGVYETKVGLVLYAPWNRVRVAGHEYVRQVVADAPPLAADDDLDADRRTSSIFVHFLSDDLPGTALDARWQGHCHKCGWRPLPPIEELRAKAKSRGKWLFV